MTIIPSEVAQAQKVDGVIPRSVAELLQETEAPEISAYNISFAQYNGKLCEIAQLDSNKARKALEHLKTIGTRIRCIADFKANNIERLPIARAGDYLRLYRGLSDDIELKEIKLQQDARIFYFDIEPERILYLVALTQNHFETDKVRK